jgi:hypothetical protein
MRRSFRTAMFTTAALILAVVALSPGTAAAASGGPSRNC